MDKFCKLYETSELGQVVVLLDTEDGMPAVQFLFKPAGLGVCKQALKFPDTEEGWDNAEAVFNKVDAQKATTLVSETMKQLGL